MQSIVLVVHVVLAMLVIGLVLIQHGKGADAGAAFGSGASSTVFGAKGSASFLTRMTTGVALAFFITSLALFYLAAHRETASRSVLEGIDLPKADQIQAIPTEEDTLKEKSESDLPSAPAPSQFESDVPLAPKVE